MVKCKSQLLESPHISDARPRDSWTGTDLKVSTLRTNFYATRRGIQASTASTSPNPVIRPTIHNKYEYGIVTPRVQ